MRKLLALATLLSLSGCGMFADDIASCNKPQPYQGSEELPPLQVPEGIDTPNTKGGMAIPAVKGEPPARPAGRCLDEPPDYYAKGVVPPTSPPTAGAASTSAAGEAGAAAAGDSLDVAMNGGRAWETRLGVTYQNKADADFEGGTTAEFATSTGFLVGIGYDLTSHFEVGANVSYDQRDYDASVAGDDPGEVFPVSGRLDTIGVVFDLTYNLMSGPFTPFLVAGVGWNWVDTRIATGPPQIGCWWNPWYGYVCTSFQDTKSVDGLAYQLGAGLRYHFNDSFSLSGSYRMSWVDFPNATSTPTFNSFNLILGWSF